MNGAGPAAAGARRAIQKVEMLNVCCMLIQENRMGVTRYVRGASNPVHGAAPAGSFVHVQVAK